MAIGKSVTAETEKNSTVYRVILATAKKKNMDLLAAYIQALEKAGTITVLIREQVSKAKLLRNFEQLRLLFSTKDEDLDIAEEVVEALDFFTISKDMPVVLKLSTFKELDVWLKWNIKEHTAQFQVRGGILDVREEKERQANGAVLRTCHYSLCGNLKLVMQYRDRMLEHKLADPEKITYNFWDKAKTKAK